MRELESMDDVLAYLQRHGTLARAYVQDVDLRPLRDRLLHTDVRNAIFLGCTLDDDLEQHLTDHGALIFPQLPDLPFDPYRAGLYTADELYKNLADGYARTPDARIFRWWRHIGRHRDLASELAMTLHDHAITDALDDLDDLNTRGDDPPTPRSDPLPTPTNPTTPTQIATTSPNLDLADAVGVMGGHRTPRGSDGYAAAARLGRQLAAEGHTVLTGGGPGAMEAVNLGAALRGSEQDLDSALDGLAAHPDFAADTDAWARTAFEVRSRFDFDGPSLGVPTWFYGHEPANPFARSIAKFFSNAIREDILLRLSSRALICLPGAAGTVQEIFQALTPRYYADRDPIPPLILVGSDYWTNTIPAWPLVESLAANRPMSASIHLCHTIAEIPALLATLAS